MCEKGHQCFLHSWMKEYNEAVKLADDINGMIFERSSLPTKKITILGTRLDSLLSFLSKLPGKQPMSEKEMNHCMDMLGNLRSKVKQMASQLNRSNFADKDNLLGPEIKPADAMSMTVGLYNQGLVGFQQLVHARYISLYDMCHMVIVDNNLFTLICHCCCSLFTRHQQVRNFLLFYYFNLNFCLHKFRLQFDDCEFLGH
ncbi:hypothetical protein UlMin_038088 [Ulmus minor]